jgi:hypothetical protein
MSQEDFEIAQRQVGLLKISDPFSVNKVAENIFSLLDEESLMECMLEDKKWSELIRSSAQVMKKMPLVIDLTEQVDHLELTKLKRNFQYVMIRGFKEKLPKNISDALKKVGANVKRIEYELGCGLNFFDILECFPKLEHIGIAGCKFLDVRDDHEPLKLPNLKYVKASFCKNVSYQFLFSRKVLILVREGSV